MFGIVDVANFDCAIGFINPHQRCDADWLFRRFVYDGMKQGVFALPSSGHNFAEACHVIGRFIAEIGPVGTGCIQGEGLKQIIGMGVYVEWFNATEAAINRRFGRVWTRGPVWLRPTNRLTV